MQKIMDSIEKGIFVLLALTISVMFTAGIMQVLFRYVIHYSLSWTEELMRYLYVWATMLGASVCVRRGEFAAIKGLQNKLNGMLYMLVVGIIYVLQCLFLVFMVVYGIRLSVMNFSQFSPAMHIPMGVFQAAVPVGGIFSLLFSLESLPQLLKMKGSEQA